MAASSSNTSPLDIAIIGAGPGGLSAAHALANQGFSVGIFERAHALHPIGAAVGLAEPGYAALQKIRPSLATQVRAQATNPKRQLLMRLNGEILFCDESPLAGTSFTWLGWYTLQTYLRQTLPASVRLFLNHHLIDFSAEPLDAPICLKFQNQSDCLARILVGADGYRSVARSKTVGDGAPLYTGTMTWRGVVPRQRLAPLADPFTEGAGFQLIVGEQKNFWMMDAGAEQLAWGGTALQSNPDKSESALATVLQVFAGWASIVEKMIRATEPTSIIETGVFDREPVSQWGDGHRVTLLGDAAHPIRPSLGLGATLAFQDAVTLAQVLAGVDSKNISAVAEALLHYEQERIRVTAPLQHQARQEGTASHADDQADRLKAAFEAALANRRKPDL
ncbi:FAD-dependent monooxygenase [Cyanobacteria bacterium FACHB-63]|nr:FAD-dependent monooxygenase [Cyanobacteria bacterium FACHB-63]